MFPADVVERFLAMRNGTVEFTATSRATPATQLHKAMFAEIPAIRQVSYNETRAEQKLTFRGVLFKEHKEKLQQQFSSPVLNDLLDDIQSQAQAFFAKYLLKQIETQPGGGFLVDDDFALLFAPLPANLSEQQQQEHVRQQRARLAQTFLPFLQQRLIRQLVVQTLTTQLGADAAMVEALLTDARLLGDPQPLLEAFTATSERGVSAGSPLATTLLADADLRLINQGAKPTGASGARFAGYLEVPTPGAYRFAVVMDKKGMQAELHFDHLPHALVSGTATKDDAEISDYVELQPGVLYSFTLEVQQLNGGDVRLLVQGETLPKNRLSQLTLYPYAAIERAERALVSLSKAVQLLQAFGLTLREVRHLATHRDDFAGFDLRLLPTRSADATEERIRQLFAQFVRLAGYARLKHDLAGGSDDLIAVFTAPTLDTAYTLLAQLTRRSNAVIEETAKTLFITPRFTSEQPLQRLWEVLQLSERFGVASSTLAKWTAIVSSKTPAQERFAIAQEVRETVKARFEPETWQHVAQPIFDSLRQRQRDALAAYVMHQHGFARIEQLYEYFLIDPGMEPVVQTSRIRLAISSVQLFIQRCLLNLEHEVHPVAINSEQWEWMKRYRVWEANRKIFLFPENWLEPEFRDDKTYLFTELEGTLLQGDVSNDLVEDAFFTYLQRLEEIARLDVVAMHCEENPHGQNTLHVIGRTFSEPHKYFYRRYTKPLWTPWEPITAEIQGDHLAPVIWRGRLYLFWVTFMEKADDTAVPGDTTANQTLAEAKLVSLVRDMKMMSDKKKVEAQLHWSEYVNGIWSTRVSSNPSSVISQTVSRFFDPKYVFIHVSKDYDKGEERGVSIHLGGVIRQAFYLAGRYSGPETRAWGSKPLLPFMDYDGYDHPTRHIDNYLLRVGLARTIIKIDGAEKDNDYRAHRIINAAGGGRYSILLPNNPTVIPTPEIASLENPFFYQDQTENTFFVEPTFNEETTTEYQEWVPDTDEQKENWSGDDDWKTRPLKSQTATPTVNKAELSLIAAVDRNARYQMNTNEDAQIKSGKKQYFNDELIDQYGSTGR